MRSRASPIDDRCPKQNESGDLEEEPDSEFEGQRFPKLKQRTPGEALKVGLAKPGAVVEHVLVSAIRPERHERVHADQDGECYSDGGETTGRHLTRVIVPG